MTANLRKGGAIAAIVAARRAKHNGAAVKDLADDRGDFANTVVLVVGADIEDAL